MQPSASLRGFVWKLRETRDVLRLPPYAASTDTSAAVLDAAVCAGSGRVGFGSPRRGATCSCSLRGQLRPLPGRPLTTCLRQKSPSGPWSSTFSRRSEFALSVFLLEGESERHSVLKLKTGNASRSQETRRQMGLFLYVTVNCCLARGLPGGRSYLSCAPAVLVWGTGILPHAPVTAVVSTLMRG